MIPSEYSFKLVKNKKIKNANMAEGVAVVTEDVADFDNNKRSFIKLAGMVGAGVVASQLLPGKAEALVMGGTPSTSVVGVKDSSNNRVDPAIKTGNLILKKTIGLTSSGTVHTPR